MGRFTKAKGPAAASAESSAGGQTPSLTPLSTLARMQPLPLSLVNTVARVTYICGHAVGDLGGILWEWGNGHVGLQSRRLYWNLWSKVGRFDVHDAGRHWFVTMPKSSGA